MIKATDLRIGNWVLVCGVEIVIFSMAPTTNGSTWGFNLFEGEMPSFYDYECEPIPLTPEILERCGFKKHKGFSAIEWHNGDIEVDEIEDGYALFASEWTIGETFYFLHELQNICLDLFKIELEIKELQNNEKINYL